MENSEMDILDALTELKHQIQSVRGMVTQSDYREELVGQPDQGKDENYSVDISTDELNALLSLSPTGRARDLSAAASETDELNEMKSEFLKFKERTSSEIKSLHESIAILSEMWGRHEMEIRKVENKKR